ncbi:lipoyl(octanoyl) transferase LipB [Ruficoccus amylovorans]|uniref:Octanoyltransferase n=1 Tax=Ruficoccus amylovorans TaxID=1804625 RepID=A0A842HCB7_9BACT|nr:lipoyl(octanoyl) transferase LipB [Ruficoccus amylovorans]MBC2594062.1 lipoyl(octanoyl) transferase LipB [Ruficoccus amylovorans]
MPLTIEDWGRTAYEDAFARQLERVEQRLDGEIGDTLILTEHESVYTIGARHGAEKHLLLAPDALASRGIQLAKTNRGGDITWHGPGQIVGYPVISLARTRDLHAYLRKIEQLIINVLGSLGLAASRRDGLTGIWLDRRKIAAIGVAVKRWVTYHGFALNVNCDLGNFGGIVPCGITPAEGTVTSISAELGCEADLAEVKQLLAAEAQELFRANDQSED